MKTTNYFNTFIEIAPDCPIEHGEIPPMRGSKKSVANIQFEMLVDHPYEYDSDHVIFSAYAEKQEIPESEWEEARALFFSKGQPCFRASPLTKRYGWGIHCNNEGKIAMYGADSEEYHQFVKDQTVEKVKAMRSKR